MLNRFIFTVIALLLNVYCFAIENIYIDSFPHKEIIKVRNGDIINLKADLVNQYQYIKLVCGKKSLVLNKKQLKKGKKPEYYALVVFADENYISNYEYENKEVDFRKIGITTTSTTKIINNKGQVIATIKFLDGKETIVDPKPDTLKQVMPSSKQTVIAEFIEGQNILADAKTLLYGKNEEKKETILKMYGAKNTDPFLSQINTDTEHSSSGKLGEKILKADVTNLATGMARFLAERAKEELNESFFVEMSKQMEKIPELQFYFPESYLVLQHYRDSKSLYLDLELLKARFESDIQKLPRNIYLTTQDVAALQSMPYLQSINNYLQNDAVGQWINYGLQSVFVNDGHLNPKDLFYDFVHNDNALKKFENKLDSLSPGRNLLNGIKLAELISNSLLSSDSNRYWVTKEELNGLLTDEKLFQTYIGLVLAKSDLKEYKIVFNNKTFKKLVEEKFLDSNKQIKNLSNLKNLIRNLHTAYFQVDQAVKQWEGSSTDQVIKSSYNIFNVFKENITIISSHIGMQKILGYDIVFDTAILYKYITPAVDIAYNIQIKKYNLAIKDFVLLLSNSKNSISIEQLSLLDVAARNAVLEGYIRNAYESKYLEKSALFKKLKDSNVIVVTEVNGKKEITIHQENINFDQLKNDKDFQDFIANESKGLNVFLTRFERYGTLIANVANAENSDEVKAAIEASVLPVGSSRAKRYSNWSLTVNSFVGAFGGQAFYKEVNGGSTENKSIATFGVTAPIGISINKGFINGKDSPSALGFMLQVIDLGALVNFYIKEGDGAALPEGSKIQLGDIIAPGGVFTYSIGDTPFTLLAGVQYVPNLNRMETIPTNDNFKPVSWRYNFGIAIDIPLFNLKVWPK